MVTGHGGESRGKERDTTYHDLEGLLTVAIFGHPSGSKPPADTGFVTRSKQQSKQV